MEVEKCWRLETCDQKYLQLWATFLCICFGRLTWQHLKNQRWHLVGCPIHSFFNSFLSIIFLFLIALWIDSILSPFHWVKVQDIPKTLQDSIESSKKLQVTTIIIKMNWSAFTCCQLSSNNLTQRLSLILKH